MRICFIGDATAIHTQRWVRWFADRHEVGVIPTGDPGELRDLAVGVLQDSAVPCMRLPKASAAVRRALARFQPDIVHCHYINESGWLGTAAGYRPLVITAWGSDIYRAPSESKLARFLNPRSARAADLMTCDSKDQAVALQSWGVDAHKIAVIGWGVDRTEFHPGVDGRETRVSLGIPLDARVILSSRRWHANCNVARIIEAHALLPDDTFLLLKRPPGPEHPQDVEQAITASPARNRIIVVPNGPPDELPSLYAAADVVATMCETDGTPASVLEVMALGKPVVALSNPSLAEWVMPEGGVLVRAAEAEPIAQALSSLLGDPERLIRASAHNIRLVATSADRSVEFGRMDALYTALLETRGAGGARG